MSVGALNMHSMQVKCEVEADPADHVKFAWTYNNTRNVSPVSIVHQRQCFVLTVNLTIEWNIYIGEE